MLVTCLFQSWWAVQREASDWEAALKITGLMRPGESHTDGLGEASLLQAAGGILIRQPGFTQEPLSPPRPLLLG